MTYYKGLIIDNKLMKQYQISKLLGTSNYPHDFKDIKISSMNISNDNLYSLKKLIIDSIKCEKNNIKIENENLIELFNNNFKNEREQIIDKINNISKNIGTTIPIVYEKVNTIIEVMKMVDYKIIESKAKELSRIKNVDYYELLQRFMFERILERISVSKYNNNFIQNV